MGPKALTGPVVAVRTPALAFLILDRGDRRQAIWPAGGRVRGYAEPDLLLTRMKTTAMKIAIATNCRTEKAAIAVTSSLVSPAATAMDAAPRRARTLSPNRQGALQPVDGRHAFRRQSTQRCEGEQRHPPRIFARAMPFAAEKDGEQVRSEGDSEQKGRRRQCRHDQGGLHEERGG